MNQKFLEAWIHAEHWILGFRLRPFCFAHLLTLQAIRSPFVENHKPIRPADILLFLKICSSSDPFRPNLCLNFWDCVLHAWLIWKPTRVKDIAQQIVHYIDDHCSFPEFWENEERTGTSITAPWILSRIASLITHTSLSYRDVMTMSIGQAVWLDAASIEIRGGELKFFDEEQVEGVEDKTIPHE